MKAHLQQFYTFKAQLQGKAGYLGFCITVSTSNTNNKIFLSPIDSQVSTLLTVID